MLAHHTRYMLLLRKILSLLGMLGLGIGVLISKPRSRYGLYCLIIVVLAWLWRGNKKIAMLSKGRIRCLWILLMSQIIWAIVMLVQGYIYFDHYRDPSLVLGFPFASFPAPECALCGEDYPPYETFLPMMWNLLCYCGLSAIVLAFLPSSLLKQKKRLYSIAFLALISMFLSFGILAVWYD